MSDEAQQYRKGNGYKNYQPPSKYSYMSLPVLQGLWGLPWDDKALNFVRSLRPSGIRVTTGAIQNNAQVWRVTVYLKSDGKTIHRMRQEVEVGVHEFASGHEAQIYYEENNNKMWLRVEL